MAPKPPPLFYQEENRLVWRHRNQTLWLEPWGVDSIRVRSTMLGSMPQRNWSLLPPPNIETDIELGDDSARLRTGATVAHVDTRGRVRFYRDGNAQPFVEESDYRTNFPPSRTFSHRGGDLFQATVSFTAWDDERIYGLGQRRHGLLDQKGCVLDLSHRNSEVSIPFLLSSRRYGLLWNNPGIGRVELARTRTRWVADATRLVDYVVVAGDSYPQILGRYAEVTGHAPVLPEWAAGFWQSKLRYQTQAELLAVAREYKQRDLPISVIVADYFHWTKMGEWKFDPECWPDPQAMIRELDDLGIRLLVSVWPTVNPDASTFDELDRRGLLVQSEQGLNSFVRFTDQGADQTVISGLLDVTHPSARDFLWNRIRENYFQFGIKLFWLDAIEPEMAEYDHANVRYHVGNGAEVGCIYPFEQQRTFYEGLQSEGEREIVTLGRAAFAGSQRFGAALWSGDIHSTWHDLRQQVRAGLNVAMSGIPWWTTDIGGFFGGRVECPDFHELLVRWFQYGTFCPLFRMHGWRNSSLEDPESSDPAQGGPNEVWSFGEDVYAILREYLFIRQRLHDYIIKQMHFAAESGSPPMRPLFFDYPNDGNAADVDDQFMLGADLLVAPVLHAGARQREVYLPQGDRWTNVWTGDQQVGGERVSVQAPLERIPLFVRDNRLDRQSIVGNHHQ